MNILSIHSHVAYGHVGNAAITLPLQRLGHDVWPVHTVMLSNHAGYADYGGRAAAAADLAAVILALDRRGALARCHAVLSGYLGDAEVGRVVLDAAARTRRYNGRALYCCDPVMGDGGALYVAADIAAFMRDCAAPAADIVTPNLFELAVLTDSAPQALDGAPIGDIVATARKLLASPRQTATVLITSLAHAGLPADHIATAAVTAAGAWLVSTPALSFAVPPHGAGDCCAALFCAALLAGDDAPSALSQTVNAIYTVLEETARRGAAELALVAAQDRMVAPHHTFSPVPIA